MSLKQCADCPLGTLKDTSEFYPPSKGGLHGYTNVQPAHPFCNRSKKDKVLI